MTEDEAKTKLCAGPPAIAAATYYRAGAAVDAPMHCLGAECMAWQWAAEPRAGKKGGNVAVEVTPGHFMTKPYSAVPKVVGDGFCGLTSAPK